MFCTFISVKRKFLFSGRKTRRPTLIFVTAESDTSLHCEKTNTGLVQCPRFRWFSLRLSTEGWPGWVNLASWLHTEIVYPSTDGHQSKY